MAYLDGWVATDMDLFAKHGFDAHVLPPNNNTADTALLVSSGKADFALDPAGGELALIAAERPVTIVGVGAAENECPLILSNDVVKKAAAEGITPKSPLADRVRFLKGLTINGGGAESPNRFALRHLLSQFGMNPDKDVKWVVSQTDVAGSQVAALKSGSDDGFLLSPPGSLAAVTDGVGQVWIDGAQGDFGQIGYYVTWETSTDMAKNHMDIVRRFLAVLKDAANTIQKHPDAVEKALRKRYSTVDQKTYQNTIHAVSPVFKGPNMTSAGLQATKKFYNQTTPGKPIKMSTLIAPASLVH